MTKLTRQSISRLSSILAAILLLLSSAYGQPEIAMLKIDSLLGTTPVVGLSVAVVKNGKLAYSKAFGYRNLDSKLPLRETDIFRIASISKSFTATCIMQLVDQGRISLDDDVSKLVGFDVRNPAHPSVVITLRMILSHRSSINDSEGYFSLDAIDPSKNPNWQKAYNPYAPGSGYMYCNLNYNMAGAILERLTGNRFDSYVKRQVLEPLGLYGGYCIDSLESDRLASIYAYNTDSVKFIPSPAAYSPRREEIANYTLGRSTPLFSPTGGMKISAADLAHYMNMHARLGRFPGGRILSRKAAKTMQTTLSPAEGYGLALLNTDKLIPGLNMRGHTGSAYGLYSAMFWHPKKHFGFVVISNGCHPAYSDGFNDLIRKTIGILYETIIN